MGLKVILLIQLLAQFAIAESADSIDESNDEFVPLPAYQSLDIPALDESNCQFQTIKKCNHKFKTMFHGKNLRAASSDKELYCRGIQAFMDCLEATTCRGTFIDNYRYVVLQHGMMDKKTSYCPNHSYANLMTEVKAIISKHAFIDDIDDDSSTTCSANTHIKCVQKFTTLMKTNSNMCKDIQMFINCYEQEATKCSANLIQHFAHLCRKLGESMLKANEKHRGMMC